MAIRASTALGAVAIGPSIPLNCEIDWAAAVQVAGTFVGTYNVEYTLDVLDGTGTPTWTAATGGSALTAPANIKLDFPVSGVRLNVTAWTSGTITMKVLQASGNG